MILLLQNFSGIGGATVPDIREKSLSCLKMLQGIYTNESLKPQTYSQLRKVLFLHQMCQGIQKKSYLENWPTTEKSLIPAPNVSRIWKKLTPTTALCLFTLHFQLWLFSRRLDIKGTRELSLVSTSSSLPKKAKVENSWWINIRL